MKKIFSLFAVMFLTVSVFAQVAPADAVLWADNFGDAQGDGQTTFTKVTTMVDDYAYAGRSGYSANATSVTYTGDDNVKLSKASGTNVTDTHLWFVKQGRGVFTTSSINLYGATEVTFSLDRSKGLTKVSYSFNGSVWNELWSESTATAQVGKKADIITTGQSVIYIKIEENNNSNNLRVDNLVLKVKTAGEDTGGDTPSISAEDNLNLTADEGEGTFVVTWTAMEDMDVNLYNDEACTSEFSGSWFQAELDDDDNVFYVVEENTGAARTVYMQLFALDSEMEEYTKVVTVTQAVALPVLTSMDAIFAKATEVGSTATDVKVTFNNWVVSGVKNNNAYVTDNAGKGFIIYASGHGFAVGDILSGTAACKVQLYNGSAELTTLTSTSNGLTVTHDGAITPQEIAIASLTGANTGAVLTYNNLAWNGTVFSDGENTITPYNTLTDISSLISGRNYNLTGVYLQYNSTKEILPRSAADMELVVAATYDITIDDNVEHGTISADKAKASAGEVVTLSATPASTYELSVWTVTDASSNPVTVTNNKFTMPASAVTVTATFVKSSYVQVFYESFDTNNGTGGNDDQWSGNIASSKMSADYTWTGAEKVNGAYQCIKLGTGSAVGYITSPELPIVGTAKIRFRAGGWAGNTANFTLSASNGTLAQTSFTPKDSEWDDYEVIITGTDHPTITFNTGGKRRIFLDEVYALQKVAGTVSVSAAEYATYYNASEAYVMPEGLVGIIVEGVNEGTLTLDTRYVEGDVVPAGEALVLHGDEDSYILPATTTSNSKIAENMLKGTSTADEDTEGGDKYYRLSQHEGQVGFYWGAADGAAFKPGANKAYLAITGNSAPSYFLFEDEEGITTDVENTQVSEKIAKIIENGQLIIVKDGVRYNAVGQIVR